MDTDWRSATEQAGAPAQVVTILAALAETHGLYPCARGGSGEIGMGAAQDAYAAFYVSHRGMTLALDPAQANELAHACALPLVRKNPTTHYVKCPTVKFGDPRCAARVSEAAEAALVRSWKGPRWDRLGAGGSTGKIPPTCPIHNYELSASGICMGCDGRPPAL